MALFRGRAQRRLPSPVLRESLGGVPPLSEEASLDIFRRTPREVSEYEPMKNFWGV
jgi:hypothetical protein